MCLYCMRSKQETENNKIILLFSVCWGQGDVKETKLFIREKWKQENISSKERYKLSVSKEMC